MQSEFEFVLSVRTIVCVYMCVHGFNLGHTYIFLDIFYDTCMFTNKNRKKMYCIVFTFTLTFLFCIPYPHMKSKCVCKEIIHFIREKKNSNILK